MGLIQTDTLKRSHCIEYGSTPLKKFDELLARFSYLIQYVKFASVGCERMTDLRQRIAICMQHNITPCVGGGFIEGAVLDGSLWDAVRDLHSMGLDHVEVSNTDLELSRQDYARLVRELAGDFKGILVEVGVKDENPRAEGGRYARVQAWEEDVDVAMQAGGEKASVILEGGGSGKVGIYNNNYETRLLLVLTLLRRMNGQLERAIIEAPAQAQQNYWLQHLGWQIGIGNMNLVDQEEFGKVRMRFLDPAVDRRVAKTREALFGMLDRAVAQLESSGRGRDAVLDINFDPNRLLDLRVMEEMYPVPEATS